MCVILFPRCRKVSPIVCVDNPSTLDTLSGENALFKGEALDIGDRLSIVRVEVNKSQEMKTSGRPRGLKTCDRVVL